MDCSSGGGALGTSLLDNPSGPPTVGAPLCEGFAKGLLRKSVEIPTVGPKGNILRKSEFPVGVVRIGCSSFFVGQVVRGSLRGL